MILLPQHFSEDVAEILGGSLYLVDRIGVGADLYQQGTVANILVVGKEVKAQGYLNRWRNS